MQDGDLVGRLHPRAAAHAAQTEAFVGIGAYDEHVAQPLLIQRQGIVLVFQQNDPLCGNLARRRMVLGRGNRRTCGAVLSVEDADEIVDAQDAPHLVVDHLDRHASGLHGVEQRRAEAAFVAARHRDVEPRECGFFGRAGLQPVGHDEAVESPAVFQYVGQHLAAVAHELEVHAVGRRHDGLYVGLPHGGLEGRQVNLVHRAIVDDRHVVVAVMLPVVAGVVLQTRSDALALNTFHLCDGQGAVQAGVLGIVLEEAAAQRIAQDVAGRAQQDAALHGPQFLAHDDARTLHDFRVPGGSEEYARGKSRRSGTPVRAARTVAPSHIGNLQTRHALEMRESARAERNFLFDGQFVQNRLDFRFAILSMSAHRSEQQQHTDKQMVEFHSISVCMIHIRSLRRRPVRAARPVAGAMRRSTDCRATRWSVPPRAVRNPRSAGSPRCLRPRPPAY